MHALNQQGTSRKFHRRIAARQMGFFFPIPIAITTDAMSLEWNLIKQLAPSMNTRQKPADGISKNDYTIPQKPRQRGKTKAGLLPHRQFGQISWLNHHTQKIEVFSKMTSLIKKMMQHQHAWLSKHPNFGQWDPLMPIMVQNAHRLSWDPLLFKMFWDTRLLCFENAKVKLEGNLGQVWNNLPANSLLPCAIQLRPQDLRWRPVIPDKEKSLATSNVIVAHKAFHTQQTK